MAITRKASDSYGQSFPECNSNRFNIDDIIAELKETENN